MESIFITISVFFLLFNFIGNAGEVLINKVSADSSNIFPNHFSLSNKRFIPYKITNKDFNKALISANSFLVADESTGRFLQNKNVSELHSIASITKLMSVLVWLDVDGDLNKVVGIKAQDYREGGIAYFIAGENVYAKDLLNIGLIASSNSAIAALVRSSGLTEAEFVGLMNKKARSWGMDNTVFVEPTGLNEKNVSTARELYILSREAFNNKIIKDTVSKKTYTFSPINKNVARTVHSTDWLLGSHDNYQVIAGKTGYIDASGYNFMVKAYDKEKDATLHVIVLGSKDINARFIDSKRLLDWTFNNYIWEL